MKYSINGNIRLLFLGALAMGLICCSGKNNGDNPKPVPDQPAEPAPETEQQ